LNIGLFYYSNTGNTRNVAEKLDKKLTEKGHNVTMEEITITGDTPAQEGKFKLKNIPNPGDYDALIFGAPVQAFSLNPVMIAYMEQLPYAMDKDIEEEISRILEETTQPLQALQ
jgi:flavodoxin